MGVRHTKSAAGLVNFARIANLKPFTLDFPSNTIKNDLLLTTKGELKMEMKKMMKRAGLGLMLAAAMAGLAGCGGNGNKESASKPAAGAKVAKVGFLNGVSGGVASYGLADKEGFDLEVEEVKKEGKTHFDVERADTKGNVQQCVSAAQKMIAAKRCLS